MQPGATEALELGVPGRSGEIAPIAAKLEHLGVDGGFAHLRYTERLEGEALFGAVEPMIRTFAGRSKSPAEVEKLLAEVTMEGYRETVLEVETQPSTLRPRRSKFEVTSRLSFSGGPVEDKHEIRAVVLDWDHAVGCKR